MAFARPQAADENAAFAREGKVQGMGQKGGVIQANTRRALGDIGNLVGPFNSRCNVGKENGAVKKNPPVQQAKVANVQGGVVTRQRAAAAAVLELRNKQETAVAPAPAGPSGWVASKPQVLQKKDTNVPAGEPKVATGKSMSSLLQSRSEAAQAERIKAMVAPASPLPDIDSSDRLDPLMASDYVADIFSYYRRVEPRVRVSPDYMNKQTDINDKMRAILIDWLVEVHLKFKLMPETLFLTTNLIDRFLEAKIVTRKNLQLVGVTAMLIASKYEEIWAPEVKDFVYISDKAYNRAQILQMEKIMLNTLKFNLTIPTPYNFLSRFLKAAGAQHDKDVVLCSNYLIELTLPDFSMLKYSYSMVAAAAVYVSRRALQKTPYFPHALQRHSGFTEATIRPCAVTLANLHRKAPNASLIAVFKKYASAKFSEIALLPSPPALLNEAE